MPSIPTVSVIMGAYNCAQTIDEAVTSIVRQSFGGWELIICDDASTDDTLAKAQAWASKDTRIHVIGNKSNLGLAKTLDRCIPESKAGLLIRHDADDISLQHRFARLVSAMEQNLDASVVGSWVTCFDNSQDLGVIRTAPRPQTVDLLHGTVFFHPSCIMRKADILSVGGYGSQPWLRRSQDYYLWFRLYAAGMHGINLQESLYRFREDSAAWKRRGLRARWMESRVRWEGFRLIRVPIWRRWLAFTPLLKCLVPGALYAWIRKRRLSSGG